MTVNFGFSTGTTGFSSTVHDAIQKAVVETLRAGLVALPKGSVIPADLAAMRGENFTLRATEYPDLDDAAATNPLTEGAAPDALKLGISTLDYDVAQVGAYTQVTDKATWQSPHNLQAIATDKIRRLAATTIDNLGMVALRAHGIDLATQAVLSTDAIVNAVAELRTRNVSPVDGGVFYGITTPKALAGLMKEDALNGWVDAAKYANGGAGITMGAVGDYRGVRFLTSSRIKPIAGSGITLANPSAAADDIIDTSTPHGFVAGDRVRFTALTGGAGLSTGTDYYVVSTSLAASTFRVAATPGGTPLGFTTDITAGTVTSYNDPVYFLGRGSVLFGDVSTMEYLQVVGPDGTDPLNQVPLRVGFKGILGGKVASFKDSTDGAGTNGSAVDRIWTISVQSDIA